MNKKPSLQIKIYCSFLKELRRKIHNLVLSFTTCQTIETRVSFPY
jgi:hypothetical protein